ncbi:MAG: hypothetical protein JO235_23220 [Chroococcidiopsidaceae cyanobacterium CP_BM_RX_35]|nr:hypothetical protein [Chroococcidiopsidaceae cyanobacterium CP_BM_RX_35]
MRLGTQGFAGGGSGTANEGETAVLPEATSGRTIKPPGDPQATSLRTAGRGSLVPTARTLLWSSASTPTPSSTQERKLILDLRSKT